MRYRESCECHPRELLTRRRKIHEGVCLCRFPDPTFNEMCACGGYITAMLVPTVARTIYRQTPELRKQCV